MWSWSWIWCSASSKRFLKCSCISFSVWNFLGNFYSGTSVNSIASSDETSESYSWWIAVLPLPAVASADYFLEAVVFACYSCTILLCLLVAAALFNLFSSCFLALASPATIISLKRVNLFYEARPSFEYILSWQELTNSSLCLF